MMNMKRRPNTRRTNNIGKGRHEGMVRMILIRLAVIAAVVCCWIAPLRVLADDCPCGQSNDDPVRQIDHQQVGRAFSGCIMHCAIPAAAVTVQETHHETPIPDPFRRADCALAIWRGLEGARL